MEIGMLWRDDEPQRPLEERVARAADYYRRKYGEQPTVCFLHPSQLPEGSGGTAEAAGLRLLAARTVQKGHLWLGVNHVAGARTRPAAERRVAEAVS